MKIPVETKKPYAHNLKRARTPKSSSKKSPLPRILQGFQTLLEYVPNGVVAVDRIGKIILTNKKCEEIFEYRRGELREKPFSLIVPQGHHSILAQSRWEQSSGSTLKILDGQGVYLGVKKNGTTVPLNVSWNIIQEPESITYLACVVLTPPLALDEKIRQVGNHLFESSTDHISIVGKDYHYQHVNRAYELAHGEVRESLIGKNIAELLGTKSFEKVVKPYINRCLAGESVEYQAWFTFKQLGRRRMRVNYFPLRSAEGDIESVAVLARDMTDLVHLENTLQRIQNALSQKTLFRSMLIKEPHTIHSNHLKLAQLSSQQKEILALVAQGKTNKEIASTIGLSDKTIRNHLTTIFKKLQISRRPQAASLFIQSLSADSK